MQNDPLETHVAVELDLGTHQTVDPLIQRIIDLAEPLAAGRPWRIINIVTSLNRVTVKFDPATMEVREKDPVRDFLVGTGAEDPSTASRLKHPTGRTEHRYIQTTTDGYECECGHVLHLGLFPWTVNPATHHQIDVRQLDVERAFEAHRTDVGAKP